MMRVRPLAAAVASAMLCLLAACDGASLSQKADEAPYAGGVSVSAASGGPATTAAQVPTAAAPSPQPKKPDYAALEQVADPARVAAFLAAALQDGRWADAARAWGETGDAGALQKRFGSGAPVTLSLGKGDSEGAAGSLYYSAPYRLRRADGSHETGTLVLRRVNDVPGASAASLRWHVERMDQGG